MGIQLENNPYQKTGGETVQEEAIEYERFLDHFDLPTRMKILGTLMGFDPELERKILTLRRPKPQPITHKSG